MIIVYNFECDSKILSLGKIRRRDLVGGEAAGAKIDRNGAHSLMGRV